MVKTKFRLAVVQKNPINFGFKSRKAVWNSLSTVVSWPKTLRHYRRTVTMCKCAHAYTYTYV